MIIHSMPKNNDAALAAFISGKSKIGDLLARIQAASADPQESPHFRLCDTWNVPAVTLGKADFGSCFLPQFNARQSVSQIARNGIYDGHLEPMLSYWNI